MTSVKSAPMLARRKHVKKISPLLDVCKQMIFYYKQWQRVYLMRSDVKIDLNLSVFVWSCAKIDVAKIWEVKKKRYTIGGGGGSSSGYGGDNTLEWPRIHEIYANICQDIDLLSNQFKSSKLLNLILITHFDNRKVNTKFCFYIRLKDFFFQFEIINKQEERMRATKNKSLIISPR